MGVRAKKHRPFPLLRRRALEKPLRRWVHWKEPGQSLRLFRRYERSHLEMHRGLWPPLRKP